MRKVILLVILTLSALCTHADDARKYREFADTVARDVYAMELPAFQIKEIPAKYNNESAVVKAVYESVEARKKTGVGVGVGMFGLPMVSRRARVEFGYLTRLLIHVNDKAAVEKYAEFDFGIDHKRKYYEGYEKNRHTMGVRLIKPDGRILDVDTSDFVEVEEGKNGEKKSRKLSIPGLEAGDDIDVFFYTESKLQNVNPDPISFCLKNEAPILNYQIHCVIDDNLSTQYRTLNGAPDFVVGRDEDNNYVLDLNMSDISSKEPRLWYSSELQSPMIKMYIFNRRNSSDFTPLSARTDGLQANPPYELIIEDRWTEDDWWAEKGPKLGGSIIKNEIRDGGKVLKELTKSVKSGSVTPVQAADYLYNLLVYDYLGLRDGISGYAFVRLYLDLLNTCKIPASLGLSSPDTMEPLDEAINLKNSIYFVKVDGNPARYYFPPVLDPMIIAPSEVSASVQGRKAAMWRKKNLRKKNPKEQFSVIPESGSDANRNVTVLDVSVKGQNVDVKRNESYRGSTKSYPVNLLTWEDIDNGYSAWLGRYGLSPSVKEKKKQTADREALYEDGRKTQMENFKKEVESYHGEAPEHFDSYRVYDIGIDPEVPDLRYEVSYTMGNYVKRAGKNLILSVGRLLSKPIELLPSDRKRDTDVYLGVPREYSTVIDISLPEGYGVDSKSLRALERTVSNAAGEFIVKTSSPSSDSIKIEIKRVYGKRMLDVSEWNDFLAIADVASDWFGSSLILEKKP